MLQKCMVPEMELVDPASFVLSGSQRRFLLLEPLCTLVNSE